MKIAVLGAGSLGCAMGGVLTEAGHEVWLINRHADRVEHLRRHGLVMRVDARDARDLRFGAARVALSAVVLQTPDQERFVRRVRQQFATNSCVGQALAAAAEICAGISARTLDL
jgi:ketopantoate reductase